ncbi:hypothetical protein PENTCL1PPCAC_4313, partial [Pristionchus entomophagus]
LLLVVPSLSFAQLQPCDRSDCGDHGTCLGWKQLKLCICDQGYLGMSCEQTACTSANSCNNNGLCLGSTTNFFCLCNLGFMGQTCNQTFSIGK